MGEVNYRICDCCDRPDHWPRMPDGTPVEKGIGVAVAARWIGKHIEHAGKRITHWTIELLHTLGRGDDAARKYGREAIWLCGDCVAAAEAAASDAALQVLKRRGMAEREEMISTRIQDFRTWEDETLAIVTQAIATRGYTSMQDLKEDLPHGVDERGAQHAVNELLSKGKLRKTEVYSVREDE